MSGRKAQFHKFCIFLAVFFAMYLLSGYSFSAGRTVQMNMAFSIGAKDDNITTGSGYAASQDGSNTLVIASSGTTISAGNVTAYSASEYMLQVTEALEDNRFLIALTSASTATIEEKMKSLGGKKILSKTFGNLVAAAPGSIFLFLRAEYDDADITTRTRWGASPVELIIKNNGDGERGPQISIELVK